MKLRTIQYALLLAMLVVGTGCFGPYQRMVPQTGYAQGSFQAAFPKTPVLPPVGLIYSDIKAPLQLNFDKTKVEGLKEAQLETQRIGIPFYPISFAWGDVNYDDMAKAARMKKIHYSDYEVFNILTIYSVTRVNLYGE